MTTNQASALSPALYQPKEIEITESQVDKEESNIDSPTKLLFQKIWNIVTAVFSNVIVQASLGALFYWINPTLFAVGFIAGIFFDEQVASGIEKIKNVWKTQPFALSLVFIGAGYLVLPVVFGASSLLGGAHLGSTMSQNAQKKLNPLKSVAFA